MSREDIEAARRRLLHFTKWGWSSGDLMEDLRTLLEIPRTGLENATIDVPGPGGAIQRYVLSGAVAVESADAVRIEPVTPRPTGAGMLRVDAPSELILTTSGTVRIATDQPYTVKTVHPRAGPAVSTVDRTANPYEIGVVYIDGQPIGKVESEPVVFDQPDPARLRPYIESFLCEAIVLHPEEEEEEEEGASPAAPADPYQSIPIGDTYDIHQ